MNFESIVALLLLIESDGRYLLINIDDPSSPLDNVPSVGIKSHTRSRRLEFRPKKFHNKFRFIGVKNSESGKNET